MTSGRAQSFGAAARDYHRFRPGYPDELADLVVAHAVGPVRRALEIGAGTGKATTLFAGRGIEVLAVEPDSGMQAVLRDETRGLPVEVLGCTFEAVDPASLGPVDLCFAGAAFHWADPATRWHRVAALLRSGGVAAVFGSQTVLADAELADRVQAIEDDASGSVDPLELSTAYIDLVDLPELTAVTQQLLPRRSTQSADYFVSHLSTVSAYLILGPELRAETLRRVRAVLPRQVELAQDIGVQLARRI